MGLFDKKYCDVCGEKIGLLGNRKLADGNLCKNCARQLSPFFSDRKQSTVNEIKEQLEYREANKEAVERFNVTNIFGKRFFIFVDSEAGNFMANANRNYVSDNPDVIPMSDIVGFDVDTRETRTEIMRKDREGNDISFNPPHYEYNYDVYMTISVRHPYFNEITFQTGDDIKVNGIGREIPDPARSLQYREAIELSDAIKEALSAGKEASAPAAAAEPRKAVQCPHCGATTIPDANGCCEYCGGAV